MNIQQQKIELRQSMLKLRQADDFDRLNFEKKIMDHIRSSELYIKSKILALYYPILGEVNVLSLAEQALLDKKKVAFPMIESETTGICFALVKNLDSDFQPGMYNVPEPNTQNFVDESDIDLFLVPGLAFDEAGNRLGMGKGYYDRYFEKTAVDIRKRLGVAFGFQIVEKLPVEEGDRGVGGVVTESGVW